MKTLVQLVRQRLPAKFGLDPAHDIQVLCPMNRGSLGTQNLNVELQAALNPPAEMKFEIDRFGVTYRHGDKVIQGRNNYDKEVYNGDIGTIVEISTDPGRIQVRFEDGRLVDYEPGELDELSLAYAITIHKSQGSEFPVVVMPVSMQQFVLLRRNLFYTGITRGRRLVVLVGEKKSPQVSCRTRRRRRTLRRPARQAAGSALIEAPAVRSATRTGMGSCYPINPTACPAGCGSLRASPAPASHTSPSS